LSENIAKSFRGLLFLTHTVVLSAMQLFVQGGPKMEFLNVCNLFTQ